MARREGAGQQPAEGQQAQASTQQEGGQQQSSAREQHPPSTRLRMNLAGEPAQTWPLGMTVPGGTSAPAATTVRLST